MLLPTNVLPPPAYDDIPRRLTTGADVTVSGVNGEDHKFHIQNLELPLTFEQLRRRIVKRGYAAPQAIICWAGDLPLTVTKGPSEFIPRKGGKINIDQPFVHYYNKVYLPAIRIEENAPTGNPPAYISKAHIRPEETEIVVGNVEIRLNRTIRVPDNEHTQALPPNMGPFKIYNVADFADKLPKSVVSKGGVFIAMYQREALWVSFSNPTPSDRAAVKVSVGGVNALTGKPQGSAGQPGELEQDYLPINMVNGQLWLDGVCTAPGVVRQFVAVPLGHGYTVESQVTGHEDVGGMQIDVFKPYPTTVTFHCKGRTMSLLQSPAQEGLSPGDHLPMHDTASTPVCLQERETLCSESLIACPIMQLRSTDEPLRDRITIFIKTLTGRTLTLPLYGGDLIYILKERIQDREGIPPIQQRLMFAGKLLQDEQSYYDCNIKDCSTIHLILKLRGGGGGGGLTGVSGFAAGGSISQKINRDQWPPFAYDDATPTRLHITVINAAHFAAMTGLPAPSTPISTATYIQHGSPWFTFYDERVPAAKFKHGLANVKSVATLDAERDARGEAKPQAKCVFCVYGKAAFRLDPCRHIICEDCASGLSSSVCPACPATVRRRERLADERDDPRFGLEVGSYEDRVIHLKRYAGAGNGTVASFILPEHAVSKLSGRKPTPDED